jgi:hypothetical protein
MEGAEHVSELWVKGGWLPITLEQALRLDSGRCMRCVECKGQTRAHKAGKDGQRAHIEHFHRNPGCSRGDCFGGVFALHPRALR